MLFVKKPPIKPKIVPDKPIIKLTAQSGIIVTPFNQQRILVLSKNVNLRLLY